MSRSNRTFFAGLFACAMLSVPYVAAAQEVTRSDFTFKRIKVPTPGSGPRINVQIRPTVAPPQAEDVAGSEAQAPPPETAAPSYDWFWDHISPSLASSGPGRLAEALKHLNTGDVPEPRLSDLLVIQEKYGVEILTATIGTQVSPALVMAMIAVESGGDAAAVSPAGAVGLLQLMPATAAQYGVEDRADPAQNIRGGVAFLDHLMGAFDADPILVLAGYNAGETAVQRYAGVPPFAETRGYVPKVLSAWTVVRGLCQTPPELISDGCAFTRPET